jgi:putative ABC transport system permease protein
MIWRLAWRNLWRNPRRTMITLSIIAFGLSLLMFLISYLEGMSEKLGDQLARSSVGHFQIHHPQYRTQRQVDLLVPEAAAVVEAVARLPEVLAVRPRLTVAATIRSSMSSTVRSVPLLGVDRTREIGASLTPEQVVVGEYVVPPPEALADNAPRRHQGRRGITLGDKLAESLNVELGSKVRLDMACLSAANCSAAWYVTGIVDSGSDTADQAIAIVDLKGLQEVLGSGDGVHEISALLHDGGNVAAVVATLTNEFASGQVPLRQMELSWVQQMAGEVEEAATEGPLAVEPWWVINPDIYAMLEMMNMASGFMYTLMLILMSSGILTTMFTVVYERKRELGVQAALGTSPWRIFYGSMAEAGWLALLGVALGTALGTVWVWLLTEYGIDLSGVTGDTESLSAGGVSVGNVLQGKMSVKVFTEPALVVFFATLVFALLPSLKMARMKPTEAMADKG